VWSNNGQRISNNQSPTILRFPANQQLVFATLRTVWAIATPACRDAYDLGFRRTFSNKYGFVKSKNGLARGASVF
jgi:hypothetical protein